MPVKTIKHDFEFVRLIINGLSNNKHVLQHSQPINLLKIATSKQ